MLPCVVGKIICRFFLHHAVFIYTFQIEPGNVVVTQFSKHNITSAATKLPRRVTVIHSERQICYHMCLYFS